MLLARRPRDRFAERVEAGVDQIALVDHVAQRVELAQVDDVAGAARDEHVERGLGDRRRSRAGCPAGSSPNALVRIGVPVRSGLMQLTRTPSAAHSSASAWVRLTTAALAEE